MSALGLFRRVRITELRHGSSTRQDVLVTVDEAPMTTIGYGGGVEANQQLRATGPGGEAREQFEFAPRGFFNIGRRNVGGRNRTVDLYTRVSLRPQRRPRRPDQGRHRPRLQRIPHRRHDPAAARLLVERRGGHRRDRAGGPHQLQLRAQGRQRRHAAPVDPVDPAVGALLVQHHPHLRRAPRRGGQATIDRLFPQVRLSRFPAPWRATPATTCSIRTAARFLSAEGTLAARSLGGQVGFSKTYLQGYWFRQLPGRRPIVFATRGAIGLADGFERDVQGRRGGTPAAIPIPGPAGDTCVIEDLPASERFFAGGDTTIRGFALDTVGTPATISANGFPRGGNAVVILNAELRVPVWREFGAAFFADGGNVFERVTNIDLGELRGALGFGLRYRSPVGPVRSTSASSSIDVSWAAASSRARCGISASARRSDRIWRLGEANPPTRVHA